MKKIYLLCLLFCISFWANAQTTVTIYASTTTTGPYATGTSIYTPAVTGTTPSPATWVTGGPTIAATKSTTQIQTGWATFDISSIPVGATISQVILGLNVKGFTGAPGTFGTCVTYATTTNLSTLAAVPADTITLYNDCIGGGGATTLWTGATGTADGSFGSGAATGGLGVGDTTMISTIAPSVSPNACNFIQINEGAGTISLSFAITTGTTSFVYNFSGDDGVLDTGGLHAPYLMITYCFHPTGVTATASPTTVCSGNTLQLTGTATGASSYQWNGPGGFTSTLLSPTLTVTPGAAGVYTLTANTLCGSGVFTQTVTASVTVDPSPAAITTTTTTVCQGGTLVLSEATAGGTWSISNTSATIVTAVTVATVTAVNAGTPVISYTLPTGCPALLDLTVNDPPTTISGPVTVCASGGQITLIDGVSGGTWSSSNTTLATVDPSGAGGGLVTGVTAGSTTISYYTGACPTVEYSMTVDPLPTNILGANVVCVNAPLPLSDATTGGTWSSSDFSIATVDLNLGVVTGVAAGTATITYTLPTSCYVTMSVTVNPIPDAISGLSAVCVGLTTTLSDATGGGTWSSSSTTVATIGSATGVVSGVSANGINITYTLPVTGCFNTLPFTVNPLPNTITGPAPPAVCIQSTVTLNDATSGGTWSSQLTSIATVDPALGSVTGVATGVSYISYTLSATGCYTSFSVTVNPLPTAVISAGGPTTFCAGGSVVLNCSVAPGDTYQWYSNGSPIIGANTSAYTFNSSQLVTVQVTDANGCVNTSAGTQVSLVQTAVITAGGPIVFCQTGNVLLSVPSAPGILYQWILNGANIPGANASTYYATLDGTYTATLNVPGGCSATTPSFIVTVYPLPIPIVTYSGGQLTTTNSYVNYQWFLNSSAIPGATTTAVTPAINGSYRVRVTDGNGCIGYSDASVIDDLGIQQINKTDIKIYPNPANSIVHIESPVTVRAIITDMEGRTLMETPDAKDLNISSFPDGLYMIMLYDDNGNRLVVQKLVKE